MEQAQALYLPILFPSHIPEARTCICLSFSDKGCSLEDGDQTNDEYTGVAILSLEFTHEARQCIGMLVCTKLTRACVWSH